MHHLGEAITINSEIGNKEALAEAQSLLAKVKADLNSLYGCHREYHQLPLSTVTHPFSDTVTNIPVWMRV